jgi:hypothetical protein
MGRIGCLCGLLPPLWLVACGGGKAPSAPSPTPVPQPSPTPTPAPSQTYVLSGTVRDYSGRTLPGAQVTLDSSVAERTTNTDAAGRYAFTEVGGTVRVNAEAEGLYNDGRSVLVLTDVSQDLELTPPLTITAGASVTAELHAGPHPSICAVFTLFGGPSDTCRAVSVHLDRPGTLKASLEWPSPTGLAPSPTGLALSQLIYVVADLPGYGPTVCCAPGMLLSLPISTQRGVTLLIRLRDPSIAPVTFTLHTSEDP